MDISNIKSSEQRHYEPSPTGVSGHRYTYEPSPGGASRQRESNTYLGIINESAHD